MALIMEFNTTCKPAEHTQELLRIHEINKQEIWNNQLWNADAESCLYLSKDYCAIIHS